jgi:tetratricopeptide (TPR) repeat protein
VAARISRQIQPVAPVGRSAALIDILAYAVPKSLLVLWVELLACFNSFREDIMSLRLSVCLLLALSCAASVLTAQDRHGHHAAAEERLGTVNFATSCNAEAQRRFERSLALLHSFWWSEAERSFQSAVEADPTCAIAYWGSALVQQGNWFAGPPSPEALQRGQAAVDKGVALHPPTPRERDYLAAVATLFQDPETRNHRSRSLAYEEAMRVLSDRYPDDVEASIFYALAVTTNALPTDRSFERQRRAGAILQRHFERFPDHPGLAHYLIHTYDVPPIAHLGEEAARKYGEIAPSVPHAQHMPSHIFTRLGLWDESIAANSASAEAARAYEVAEGMTAVSFDRAHAWDYLVYAYLQQGREGPARKVLEQVENSTASPSIATDYAFAAIPARMVLERSEWAGAAELHVRPSPAFLAGEAITRFARGVGAARSGRPQAAHAELAELTALRDELRSRADPYWSEIVEAQRLSVEAWVAFEAGKPDAALDLISSAASLEERMDKHPVTPGPILPAREMQAEMLLLLDRPGDALRTFDAAALLDPNRARNRFGSAQAAERAGLMDEARRRYEAYLDLMSLADSDRPQIETAKRFIASAPRNRQN